MKSRLILKILIAFLSFAGNASEVNCAEFFGKPQIVHYSPHLLRLYQKAFPEFRNESFASFAESVAEFQRQFLVKTGFKGKRKVMPDWEAGATMVEATEFYRDLSNRVVWGLQKMRYRSANQTETQLLIQGFDLVTGLTVNIQPMEVSKEEFLTHALEWDPIGLVPRLNSAVHLRDNLVAYVDPHEEVLMVLEISDTDAREIFRTDTSPTAKVERVFKVIEKNRDTNVVIQLKSGKRVRFQLTSTTTPK